LQSEPKSASRRRYSGISVAAALLRTPSQQINLDSLPFNGFVPIAQLGIDGAPDEIGNRSDSPFRVKLDLLRDYLPEMLVELDCNPRIFGTGFLIGLAFQGNPPGGSSLSISITIVYIYIIVFFDS
jgi:hypothetical protein